MVRRALLLSFSLALTLLASASPAVAGGWASVRLEEAPPAVIRAGVTWTARIVVKQHDQTPIAVDPVTVTAANVATGDRVSATAQALPEVGRYEFSLTFPSAGDWKWSVTPGPFPEVGMESLHVASADAGMVQLAAGGDCGAPGKAVAVGTLDPDGATMAGSYPLPDDARSLVDGGAVLVRIDVGEGAPICAEMPFAASPVVVPLSGGDLIGAAALEAVSGDLTLSVVLWRKPGGASGPATTVEIKDMQFSPASVTIKRGERVTWFNHDTVAHSVQGVDLPGDSGMLNPGESFTLTFAASGTFSYQCGPHPGMTGTVTVV